MRYREDIVGTKYHYVCVEYGYEILNFIFVCIGITGKPLKYNMSGGIIYYWILIIKLSEFGTFKINEEVK